MLQRKPKDSGAMGARSLRGGKNKYSAKTLNGNWVESQYDPAFVDVDVDSAHSSSFLTIQQLAAREGAGKNIGGELYGAALVKPHTGPKNFINYNPQAFRSSEWQSVTGSAHRGAETKVRKSRASVVYDMTWSM